MKAREFIPVRPVDGGHIVILAALYFLLGKLSFSLSVEYSNITNVYFLSEGVALAYAILVGPQIWPGIFLGQLGLALSTGLPAGFAASIAASNSFEAVVGVLLFRRLKLSIALDRTRDVLWFVGLIALVLQPLSATLGVVPQWLTGRISPGNVDNAWLSWWTGNTLGQLLVTPVVLAWSIRQSFRFQRAAALERGLVASLLLAMTAGAFGWLTHVDIAHPLIVFAAFYPVLTLIAIRYGARMATTCVLLTSYAALIATVHGYGPFSSGLVADRVAYLNTFVAGSALTTLLLTAIMAEVHGAEQQLTTFFNVSLDLLCMANFEGYFTRVSPAWTQTLGWSVEEMLANPYLDFIHPDDRENTIQAAAGLAHGSSVVGFDNRYRCRDGSYRWLSWSAVCVQKRQLIVAAARDVTDRKSADERLRESASALVRSNAELEQFASVASHDLQEPLRMVASYVQLLDRRYRGKLDVDADKYIHYAVDGAKRMQHLIDDLLLYARVDSRGKPFALVEISSVWELVLTNLQIAITEQNAVVTHDAPLPAVFGDEPQLTQLLQNLIANAIKFHRPAETPRVHLGVRPAPTEWVFSVRDNGLGIDAKYYDRIFEIFQRLHGREEYPGTGIGLALCKKIAERHGGRIWVESTPNTGSTFFFTIPKQPAIRS